MIYFLIALCTALIIIICLLCFKIYQLRLTAKELSRQIAEHIGNDTNSGISILCGDKKLRALAAEIDKYIRTMRRFKLRYQNGGRELKDAVTNISHDLRTPLTAISGYIDLLENEEKSEKANEYLNIISERTQTMKNLIQELLDFSIILSDNQYNEKSAVSLNSAFEEGLAANYSLLRQRGITPTVLTPDKEIVRCLNKSALLRILGNIISNAAKYSDGDFTAELRPNGEMLFSNTANGLNAVKVGRLFDKFFTVQNGRSSTGLGLSIARTLTENMGGSLTADYYDNVLTIRLYFPNAAVS